MEVRQSLIHLSRVELSLALGEPFDFLQVLEKLPSPNKFHHEKDFILGLEPIFEIDEEGMLGQL